MRQTFLVLLSFLSLATVQAFPFNAYLIQARHVITETRQLHPRQNLLDGLASIASDISTAFNGSPTNTLNSASVATRTADSGDDEDEDETTSARTTATRTTASARETTSAPTETSTSVESTSSSDEESSTTSESSTSETATSSTSTSSTSATNAAASATSSPTAESSGGKVNTAAIAGGIAGGVVLIVALVIILFWGCGPLKKWRENRAYKQMMDRTYRPALDEFFAPEKPQQNGLGLNPSGLTTTVTGGAISAGYRGFGPAPPSAAALTPRQRAFSFDNGEQGIRRKPLPTIGTGGSGQPVSPMTPTYTTFNNDRAEPWLPRAGGR